MSFLIIIVGLDYEHSLFFVTFQYYANGFEDYFQIEE